MEDCRRMRTELCGLACADKEAAMDLSMPAVTERRAGPDGPEALPLALVAPALPGGSTMVCGVG